MKKNTGLTFRFCITSLLFLILSISTVDLAVAQDVPISPLSPPSGGGGGSKEGGTAAAVRNLIGGYGSDQLKDTETALFKQTEDSFYNILSGMAFDTLKVPNQATPQAPIEDQDASKQPGGTGAAGKKEKEQGDATTTAIYELLTTTNPTLSVRKYAFMPAPIPAAAQGVGMYGPTGASGKDQAPYLNFTDFFNPIQYSDDQQKEARNFIQFATGITLPDAVIDLSKIPSDQLEQQLKNNTNLQQYLVAKRNLTAAQSVAISNLFMIFAERIKQDTSKMDVTAETREKAKQAGLYPEASPLKLAHYMATRRYTDKEWTSNIQELATPAELQRQTIYLLRDLNYQLFQLRMTNERLLATISVMEVQGVNAASTLTLGQLYQNVMNTAPFKTDDDSGNNGD